MRDLTFFNRKADYEEFIYAKFLPDFRENPFYGNLIQFVIDQRAPLFYKISHPSEHFAFSGAFHFETERERYDNPYRRNLFWLHDFTHMLFQWTKTHDGHDLMDTTERQFIETFWTQERLASTETEIFAYYRMPGLREKVFPDETLWYDVLVEPGQTHVRHHLYGRQKPRAEKFLVYRQAVQMNDLFGDCELGDHPEILKWVQSWRELTPKWCSKRFRSLASVRIPSYPWTRFSADTYEGGIESYVSAATQDDYERLTIANITIAYALLGKTNPPLRWRHVPDALRQLEGAVFFVDGAGDR